MRAVLVSAGLSVPSSTRLLGDRLAAAVVRRAAGDGADGTDVIDRTDVVEGADGAASGSGSGSRNVEVQVVELRELAVEIAHHFTNGFPGPSLAAALRAVTEADALIVVTPVFSASYSGLFKSFFDVMEKDALAGTPVLIGATGGSARHSLVLEHAMRPLFAYLRAVVVPTAVYAASEDWGADGLAERIERAAGELAGLLGGAGARRRTPAASPAGAAVEDVVPFAERLAALRR
ncbi:CE1759 family FMN reductase [Streptomyces sp. C1-2]|uniref:CE1759 family FMN reductase n=1 Tax=Streptomyces sp. C1-2 TaxID=2720022 RepID=UPI0014324941|nr:CE1759 family FMN reductase [Streptomyces sp. C1-2]NJP70154.1 oxidoreductase [Streptomyces sp. C1-2]